MLGDRLMHLMKKCEKCRAYDSFLASTWIGKSCVICGTSLEIKEIRKMIAQSEKSRGYTSKEEE